jgi:lipopolysaccharide biosynthesis protein
LWCRPEVLKPLLELDIVIEDLRTEPHDATSKLWRGLERLLPALANSQQFRIAKTCIAGLTWSRPE